MYRQPQLELLVHAVPTLEETESASEFHRGGVQINLFILSFDVTKLHCEAPETVGAIKVPINLLAVNHQHCVPVSTKSGELENDTGSGTEEKRGVY